MHHSTRLTIKRQTLGQTRQTHPKQIPKKHTQISPKFPKTNVRKPTPNQSMVFYGYFIVYLMVILWLLYGYCMVIVWLFYGYLWLFDDYLMTIWLLFKLVLWVLMVVLWLFLGWFCVSTFRKSLEQLFQVSGLKMRNQFHITLKLFLLTNGSENYFWMLIKNLSFRRTLFFSKWKLWFWVWNYI